MLVHSIFAISFFTVTALEDDYREIPAMIAKTGESFAYAMWNESDQNRDFLLLSLKP